jgi:hypothetical protein
MGRLEADNAATGKINGLGTSVPPIKAHVQIYFSQHGQPPEAAEKFFDMYSVACWKNTRGRLISNWKVHAWQWIWERMK